MKTNFLKTILSCSIVLLSYCGHSQTFTITPGTTSPFFKAPTGTTGASTVYSPTDTSLNAPNGIWVIDRYRFNGGFMLEWQGKLTTERYTQPGAIFCKPGTVSIGFSQGKLKLDWIAGEDEQINGLRTLPVGQWITIRIGVDTLGRVSASVNGILDIDRATQFSGPMPEKTDQLIFLRSSTARTRSIRFWADTKPDILPPGFDCFVRNQGDSLKFRFKRIDRTLNNTPLVIVQESPNGAQSILHTGKLSPGALTFHWKDYQNGNWTFRISAGKINYTKSVLKAAAPVLPSEFINGLYFPNKADFRFCREKLKINTVYCDFNIMNFPGNWLQMGSYLDSAQKYGLKTVIRAGFHASKGNLYFADSLQRTVIARYYQDEAAGLFHGFERNHWAKNATQPTVPGILNLNNFSRIDEASEMADILMLNIYSSGRKVFDKTSQARELAPTWVTLPQYAGVQYNLDTMINLVGQAITAGASGIFWFEFDHRSTAKPNDYYTSTRPELIERLRYCYNLTQGVILDFTPLSTGNPNVSACYRGKKLWICNLTSQPQTATILGKTITLTDKEVKPGIDQL